MEIKLILIIVIIFILKKILEKIFKKIMNKIGSIYKFILGILIVISFHYMHTYNKNKVYKELSLIVSPAFSDDFDFSNLYSEKYDSFIFYKLKNNIFFYIEKENTYKSSNLLKIIELEDFGDIVYKNRSSVQEYKFNTKILLIKNKNNCEEYAKDFSIELKERIQKKNILLNIKINYNSKTNVYKIFNDTFLPYEMPRLFVKCQNDKFLFLVAN